jgi:hypothetical protein
MSVKIMSTVFDKSKTEGNARLVLLALADCANDEGTCWPSISTISSMANINQQTTRKYLWAMESIGLITAEDRKDKIGRRTSNLYKINREKLGEDVITKEDLKGQLYKSQIRTWDYDKGDTISRHTVAPYNPSHSGDTIKHHTGSYMKHHNEPSLEPPVVESSAMASHSTDGVVELTAQASAADAEVGETFVSDSIPPNSIKPITGAERRKSPPIDQAKLAAFKTRANKIFRRRETTPWSRSEERAAKLHLDTPDSEWGLLEKYYANSGQKGFYCRTTMATFLNNFAGEIDRAKAKFPDEENDPDFWNKWKPRD